MKKLAASISVTAIVSMMAFTAPTFANGGVMPGTSTYNTTNYNNDGKMADIKPSTNTTINTNSRANLNNMDMSRNVDPYGSYYNSTNNNGRYDMQSASPRMNSYGIRSTTRDVVDYGTRSFDKASTNLYRATAATTTDDNDFDWGWLGLLGLIGLAGLRSKDRERT
ncbi:WGxxGxxG family protein [Paenibacillus solisilvae]|uniref:WGxxGxxG family protein n=1 Tax=Paenibacillus solisilvae TaxID=2486751 RepID=A0ABW0VXX9_9BACL